MTAAIAVILWIVAGFAYLADMPATTYLFMFFAMVATAYALWGDD